jgi:hypothetical protein
MCRPTTVALVLLLVAAGCSGGGLETPADTLNRSDEPESTFGYAITDVPDGYALCAVSTPSAFSLTSEPSASLMVYGEAAATDPYTGPLIGIALFEAVLLDDLPLGTTESVTVSGAPGRLGGADGLLGADLPADVGHVLTFRSADDKTVQVLVRGSEEFDLVELGEGVRIDDDVAALSTDAVPPGFVGLGDLYQLEGRAQFQFALDHQRPDADGGLVDQITLLGSRGSREALEAFRFRAAVSEVIDVNGAYGVAADIGPDGTGPFVVSWMVDGDLILRMFSFAMRSAGLREVAASVERVEGDEWAELRSAFDPPQCEF